MYLRVELETRRSTRTRTRYEFVDQKETNTNPPKKNI